MLIKEKHHVKRYNFQFLKKKSLKDETKEYSNFLKIELNVRDSVGIKFKLLVLNFLGLKVHFIGKNMNFIAYL